MDRFIQILLLTITVTAKGCFAYHNSEFDVHRLMSKLMSGYSTAVRPVVNYRDTVTVDLSLTLVELLDMDEVNQIMTTSLWMTQKWQDAALTWDPRDYGNITSIRIPIEQLWRPDLVLYNNANDNLEGGIQMTQAVVSSDGFVKWNAPTILKSACEMNPLKFPFDVQTCVLKFGSWSFHGNQLDVVIRESEADISVYESSGEWALVSMPARREVTYYPCCPEPYPIVSYDVIIKRSPLFYVMNLMLPCILLSAMILLGFCLPPDAGERITLTITVLLSLTVFQVLVAETLPPTSDVVPYISQYYALIIMLVGICTVLSIVTLSMHHRGDSVQLSQTYRRGMLFLAKMVFLECPNIKMAAKKYHEIKTARDNAIRGAHNPAFEDDELDDDNEEPQIAAPYANGSSTDDVKQLFKQDNETTTPIDKYMTRISDGLAFLAKRQTGKDDSEQTSREWMESANAVDRLFTVVFLILGTFTTILMIWLAAA
ncbi:putative neuronal acetylcholine receptor subunit alpha-10 [Apostichopus japonicus]|uniref:Putative neuronal acetylcholine receptor subunit alpha-10 n=2 Tax=Stichopus japonicus TaxID=307972 RepID=A0A2G8K2C6_STIJA|nr:putative neuronal acetylcholine receptor subunit alpha-10 [Apostichopus japonicus]